MKAKNLLVLTLFVTGVNNGLYAETAKVKDTKAAVKKEEVVKAASPKTETVKTEKAPVAAGEKDTKQETSRKKKVEMCAGCGKPEKNCDCDHGKKG